MEQSQSLWNGRTLERITSPPTPTGEKGIFSWVKSAFTAPLVISRSGTPSQGGDRNRAASRTMYTSSAASGEATQHLPTTAVPSHSSSSLSSSSPPPPMSRGTQRMSTSSSFATSSSYARMSPDGDEDNVGDDDEDAEDDELDSDDEVYIPYKPSSTSEPQQPSANEQLSVQTLAASDAPPLGLVKPTARRSVSLHYGQDQVLYGDSPRSIRRPHDGEVSRSSSILTDDSSPASVMSTPSLVLTAPDSNETEDIGSPLVAGWPANTTQAPSHNNLDFGPLLSRSYSLEDDVDPGEDGEPFAPAVGTQPRQNKGTILMGNEAAQLDQYRSHSSGSTSNSDAKVIRKEDWDESRARTPKVFADLQGAPFRDARDTNTTTLLPAKEAAEEIVERGGPTPKPSFWNQSSPRQSPQQVKPVPVKASHVPAPGSPVRRKLFGRRRIESVGKKISGEDSITSHEVSVAPGKLGGNNKGVHPNAASSFWRLGRKASVSHDGLTSTTDALSDMSLHRHSIAPSMSACSSFSIEVPESISASSMGGDGRPKSVMLQSDTSSVGRYSSRGRTVRVKIRASVGLNGQAAAQRTKTRSKNKGGLPLHFRNLCLAQELTLDTESTNASTESSSSSNAVSASLSKGEPSVSCLPTERPEMPAVETQQSIAGSALSHDTSGSFASQTQGRKATWAMKFSLDGRYLATAGQDQIIRIYAVLGDEAKRQVELSLLQTREEARRCLNVSGTSSHEEGSTPSRKGKTPDAHSRLSPLTPLPVFSSRPVGEFRGHTSDILSLDWSKGNFLLSSSMDKTVKVWHLDRASSLVTFVHGDFVCSAVFHKDDRFFLSGSLDGKLRLWNIAAKKVHAVVDVPGLITAVAFSPSGNFAIAGTFSGAILIYRMDDLSYQNSVAVRRSSSKHARGTKITGIEAIPNAPGAVNDQGSSASQQKERILITSNDSRIRVYDLTEKRLIAKFKGHTYLNRTSQIRSFFDIDDRLVVTGSESGEVYVWDWATESSETGSSSASGSKSSSGAQPYECWTAADGARPITAALLAPPKSHALLAASGDPIEAVSGKMTQADARISQRRIVVSVESHVIRVWRAVMPPSDQSLIAERQ